MPKPDVDRTILNEARRLEADAPCMSVGEILGLIPVAARP
jgi:hypothetical protein